MSKLDTRSRTQVLREKAMAFATEYDHFTTKALASELGLDMKRTADMQRFRQVVAWLKDSGVPLVHVYQREPWWTTAPCDYVLIEQQRRQAKRQLNEAARHAILLETLPQTKVVQAAYTGVVRQRQHVKLLRGFKPDPHASAATLVVVDRLNARGMDRRRAQ